MRRFRKTIIINTKNKTWEQIKHASRHGSAIKPVELIGAGIIILVGLGLISTGVLFQFGINPLHASGNGWAGVMAGSVFAGSGGLYLFLSTVARRLIPEGQLQERLNTDDKTLHQAMDKHQVRPRFIINGDRYYSRSDFGEIATLLRASTAPATPPEALLRPATGQVETPPEHLLRAAEGQADAPAPNAAVGQQPHRASFEAARSAPPPETPQVVRIGEPPPSAL